MFSRSGPIGQWISLLLLSAALRAIDLPGALLLGPMASGIVMAFQTVRLILVIIVGPIMARRVARVMGHMPK